MTTNRLFKSILFTVLVLVMLPLYAAETTEETANKIIAASKEYKDFMQFNSQLPVTFHTKRQPKVFVEGLTVKIIQPEYGFSLFEIEGKQYDFHRMDEFIVISEKGNITFLHFEPEKITDIQKIKNYKQLSGLYIHDAPLKATELNLSGLSKLSEIYVSNNKFSSIVLGKNNKIKTVAIKFEPISNINNLNNLEYLHLLSTNVTSLNSLTNSKKLRYLDIENVSLKISKIPPLTNFPLLAYINIIATNITEISGLTDCKNLKYLLVNDKLNWPDLIFPSSLEELMISGPGMTTFPNLSNLTSLKKLRIGWAKVSKISGLDNLVKLEHLRLGTMPLESLSGLEKLSNLKSLTIKETNISKIEGLDSLKNLEELDLSHNKITKVEGLNKLDNIRTIKLDNNTITDYDLSEVEGLTTLRSITLDSNPFSDDLMNKDIKHWRKLYKAGKI